MDWYTERMLPERCTTYSSTSTNTNTNTNANTNTNTNTNTTCYRRLP